jgi:hypothetical protein
MLSSGADPAVPEPVELASEVWPPPAVEPPPVLAPVDPEPDPVDPLPAEPAPFVVGFGVGVEQKRVEVVEPAGSVGCGFNDCETQAAPWLGVSAKAGADAIIAPKPNIGTLASAVNDSMMSLRIETPPRGDASTLSEAGGTSRAPGAG